jgi:T5SS/PEP-CTERM-associated repeat protein
MSEATRRAVARKTTDITTFPATGHRIERLRWKCRPVPIAALVAALTSLSFESASAQTWSGATSNDWTVGSNWSGGAVPTGVSGVVINKAPGVVLGVNGATTGATNGVILTTGLTIENGSTLNSAGIAGIASTVGSTSTATVTGAGSVWNVGGQLNAGGTGTGTLNIENGAEVNAHAGVKVGLLATASGTLNINSGGLLQTTSLAGGAGAAQVNFDDATIRALASSPTFISGLTVSQLNIAAGGLTVDTNGFSARPDLAAPAA